MIANPPNHAVSLDAPLPAEMAAGAEQIGVRKAQMRLESRFVLTGAVYRLVYLRPRPAATPVP